MLFDFPKLLEKKLAYDLIYRVFLWAGIAVLFYCLAAFANQHGENGIAKALHKGDRWNLLGTSALIVWVVGCFAKNVTLKLTEGTWGYSVGSCITSVVGKVAIDMLLATFGLGASYLGYLVYYIRFDYPAAAPISVSIFLGFGVVHMLLMLSVLGVCIAILKAKLDSAVAKTMRKIEWRWVFLIYPSIIVFMVAMLWRNS